MIHTTVTIIQIIAVILLFLCILVLALKPANSFSNVMLLAFMAGFIQNVGYLLELLSYDVTTSMNAIRVEYTGGAFIISMFTWFIFKYCRHELPKPFLVVFILEGFLVLLGVWSFGYNDMFYTKAKFIKDAAIPYVQLGHGWFYYVFAVLTISELVTNIIMCLLSYIKTKETYMRRNYAILFVVVVMPLLGYMVSIMGNIPGYDLTPLSVALSIIVFTLAILRNHVFDVAKYASETIFNNLDSPVIILNRGNGFEGANLRAKRLFPDLFEFKTGEYIHDEKILELFEEDMAEIKIDDEVYEVSISPIYSGDDLIGKSVILFDITERKRQLEKTKELMDKADQANVAKSAFLTNVSHEIRTPINVIMGMSEVLFRDFRRQETDEYVANIRTAASTLLSLINDILDFSKIDTGKLSIIDEEYDAKKMYTELITVYKFRCEKKGVQFIADIPEDLPKYLIGDAVRVKQIHNNLLSNAIKYTENGQIKLKVSYKKRTDYEIDLIVSVEDTGIGIRREDQNKIFTVFSRVDLKKTNTIEGTGLGLNISKELVSMMKGAVNFKSEYGKGSMFSFVIPQKVSASKNDLFGTINTDMGIEVFNTNYTAKDAKVLVVDDSKTNLIVAKELLKKTMVDITTALSGEECLKLCEENEYDIIFLDHRMPGMDGLETFEKLKAGPNKCQNTPVIMLTANAIGDARDFYLNMDFTDFLSKPITSKELIEMVKKYLPDEKVLYEPCIDPSI